MKGWKAAKAWLTRLIDTDGGDWAMLLVSLLLAFSIWLIHNLSLKVSADVTVRVEAHTNLEGHSTFSSNIVAVTAQCYATGFNHIRARIADGKVRKVTFAPEHFQSEGGDAFSISEKALSSYAKEIFGSGFRVDSFDAESLTFIFPNTPSKKVPVSFVGDFVCRPQYMIVDGIQLSPDSVVVTGPAHILDKVSEVCTSPLYLDGVDSDLSGTLRLKPIADVRIQNIPVNYKASVTRYVEKTASFRVSVMNVPADRQAITIPSEVSVSFRVPFNSPAVIEEQASFHIDYEDFLRSYSGLCLVKPDRDMPEVISWSSEPAMVECLVSER